MQKTAYEMRISDWSSDVCSSDLPSAVFIGSGEAPAEALKKFGAEKVYSVDDAEIKGYLVAPKAEVLAQLAEKTSPAAILIPSSAEGKKIAGRLAIKISSGVITDAVDVAEGGVTTQSVFAGSYTVQAKVTKGTPIITVKPNSAAPEEEIGRASCRERVCQYVKISVVAV